MKCLIAGRRYKETTKRPSLLLPHFEVRFVCKAAERAEPAVRGVSEFSQLVKSGSVIN